MSRNASLDGLRGIAALTVATYHGYGPVWDETFHSAWAPGYLAVRLFFVLSGALITHQLIGLLATSSSPTAACYQFAVRRALRILPLAYSALFVGWLAGSPAMQERPWWYIGFVSNMGWQWYGKDWPAGFEHFWTLAVEEQVYLLWPALLIVVGLGRWPVAAAVLIVGSFAYKAALDHTWTTWMPAHLDGFAAGALIGWAATRGTLRETVRWLGTIGVSAILTSLWFDDQINRAALDTASVFCLAWLVGWAWEHPRCPGLSWRPLVWIGTLSYGIYVWHEVLPFVLQDTIRVDGVGLKLALWKMSLGVAGAALTWYTFERRVSRLKDRLAPLRIRQGHADQHRSSLSVPRSLVAERDPS